MQTVQKDVKSGKEVVAQVAVPVFDNLDECEETLGADKCVSLINRGHSVALMDDARRDATGGGGTGIRALMAKVKEDPELLAKIKAMVEGDDAA